MDAYIVDFYSEKMVFLNLDDALNYIKGKMSGEKSCQIEKTVYFPEAEEPKDE